MKPQIPINQCFLYRCRSKKDLANKLSIEPGDLKARSEWIRYTISQIPKTHGDGTRTIYAPCKKLKAVQKHILRYLQRIEKPAWVFSGTKGKCHIDNALSHEGRPHVILTDIESFYEHCTREMVYKFFLNVLETSPDVAEALADLTTFENAQGIKIVPSGSPCSQLLAYFAYRDMFEELSSCAHEYGCRLSLYVDDLTLSSDQPISSPKNLEKTLAKIMRAYGHRLKWEKTKYIGRNDFKIVTGVALDGSGNPQIPNRLGEGIVEGLRDSARGETSQIAPTLGRIGAARQIDPNAFPSAKRALVQMSGH